MVKLVGFNHEVFIECRCSKTVPIIASYGSWIDPSRFSLQYRCAFCGVAWFTSAQQAKTFWTLVKLVGANIPVLEAFLNEST